jgi:hypothetical protein
MKNKMQIMKSTPQATRFAAFALAITAVLGTSAIAQSVDSPKTDLDGAIKNSAPARPAAKPAAQAAKPAQNARPAQNAARPAQNTARPAQNAARPNAARPSEAGKSAAHTNAARPEAARNAAHPNTARPEAGRNAAHDSRPEARHEAAHDNRAHDSRPEARHEAARDNHGARGNEHSARGNEKGAADHGRPAAKNASYSHGTHAENLHGGKRIPEDRFRGSFGRDHQFHIGHPVMIGGQASFQFGGFWFGLVDPWPAAWLYTDAVFVDFVDGGYVLVNVAHPEVTIEVSAGDPVPATCTAEAAVPVAPVVAAPVVAAPVVVAGPVVVAYPYLTWHYWRHYWR